MSPFSPFLMLTPDAKELWLTHKDVGKVTRIDEEKFSVIGTIDTGFITNHLAFIKAKDKTLAYVTVGGENRVKVYDLAHVGKPVAEIKVGALPHGIWALDDGSRVFVGLENGDGLAVIETSSNEVIKTIPIGQAPQALVYLSKAVTDDKGDANLSARMPMPQNIAFALKPRSGKAKGLAVVRSLGPVDSFEINLFRMRPNAEPMIKAWGMLR